MSCDWKSASACAQARRLLLLSLLLAGVTLLLAATASAAYSVTVTPGTVLNTGTGNGAKLGINLDHWWDSDGQPAKRLHAARHVADECQAQSQAGPNEVWSDGDEVYGIVTKLLFCVRL